MSISQNFHFMQLLLKKSPPTTTKDGRHALKHAGKPSTAVLQPHLIC